MAAEVPEARPVAALAQGLQRLGLDQVEGPFHRPFGGSVGPEALDLQVHPALYDGNPRKA